MSNRELVLKLRRDGKMIYEIIKITGLSATAVCEILYNEPSYRGVF